MGYPYFQIDLEKITANTRTITALCRSQGIEAAAVTKSFAADPVIAGALLAGGIKMLADSRVQNLRKLRQAGIAAPLLLLRVPLPSQVDEVVEFADYCVVSELSTVRLLSRAAADRGKIQNIILMVEMGDRREGILPEKVLPTIREILTLPNISLEGLGANFACFCGLAPTAELLADLAALADEARRTFSLALPLVSAGNSANLNLLETGRTPAGINHLRIGEAILLGNETLERRRLAGMHYDAFQLCVEVVEVQDKPTLPGGETAQNAFGERPVFEDRGIRRRAIAGIGRQDIPLDSITSAMPGIEILGGSSDYLLLDVTDAAVPVEVGGETWFNIDYSTLVHGFLSPFIDRQYRGSRP